MKFFNQYAKQIEDICKINTVNELYAFGSVLTDKFNSESDIDLVVSILEKNPIDYAEKYFNLKFELERLLNKKIDLLEQKSIRNIVFQGIINKQKKLIYARRDKSVA